MRMDVRGSAPPWATAPEEELGPYGIAKAPTDPHSPLGAWARESANRLCEDFESGTGVSTAPGGERMSALLQGLGLGPGEDAVPEPLFVANRNGAAQVHHKGRGSAAGRAGHLASHGQVVTESTRDQSVLEGLQGLRRKPAPQGMRTTSSTSEVGALLSFDPSAEPAARPQGQSSSPDESSEFLPGRKLTKQSTANKLHGTSPEYGLFGPERRTTPTRDINAHGMSEERELFGPGSRKSRASGRGMGQRSTVLQEAATEEAVLQIHTSDGKTIYVNPSGRKGRSPSRGGASSVFGSEPASTDEAQRELAREERSVNGHIRRRPVVSSLFRGEEESQEAPAEQAPERAGSAGMASGQMHRRGARGSGSSQGARKSEVMHAFSPQAPDTAPAPPKRRFHSNSSGGARAALMDASAPTDDRAEDDYSGRYATLGAAGVTSSQGDATRPTSKGRFRANRPGTAVPSDGSQAKALFDDHRAPSPRLASPAR